MRPLFITTPIYYVNDIPHIGHAYTTISADVLARHHRNFGRRVFFLTGTDEHGLKVQKAASERGVDPKKHCDETVERFIRLWERLNISNDAFIRTTDADHIAFVRKALEDLKARDEIEARNYSGFYCTPCERFWTDKDLQEGNCPDCRRPVEQLEEKNYFFKMGRRRDAIREAVREDQLAIVPPSRKNEVLGFLDQPLSDLCISRPKKRLEWGIPLPFDNGYVTYVWFDALLNYTSALVYAPRPGPTATTPPAWADSEIVHLIGKDILTTHAVYWPAMLMGLGWALPTRIVAHGWWTSEGRKMSKSLGNVVDPFAVTDEFGVDAFRYFLLREVPFGQDGDFSRASMISRVNHDLADEFGNLVSRVVALIRQKEKGQIDLSAYVSDAGEGLRRKSLAACREATESLQFSVALGALAELFSHLNKTINDERPWEAPEDRRRKVLATCAVDLARGIFLLSAYTPALAAEAARQIGCAAVFADPAALFSDDAIRRAAPWRISPGKPIVAKVGMDKEEPPKPAEAKKEQAKTADPGTIDISDFQKVSLRTAKILKAERVEGSDKLIKLGVAIGPEERQVVAGIGKRYTPEELVGKTVIIVANLKPRKVFGVESNGMILAAGGETDLCLLTLDGDGPHGLPVK